MTIDIQCPACSKKLSVPDSFAGKRGKCPSCSTKIDIPAAPKPALETVPTVSEAKAQPPAIAAPPRIDAETSPVIAKPMIDSQGDNPYSPAVASSSMPKPHPGSSTITVRQLDTISVAKTFGVLYGILGLILGVMFGGLTLIGALAGASSRTGTAEMIGVGVGGAIVMAILAPLFYGAMGFIAGLLSGVLYNLTAKFSGGIKFET